MGRRQIPADDPVEMHLPELAGMQVFVEQNEDGSWVTEPADHPMTVRELMSHTEGWPYATAQSGPGSRSLRQCRHHEPHWSHTGRIHARSEGYPAVLPAGEPVYSILLMSRATWRAPSACALALSGHLLFQPLEWSIPILSN